MTLRDDAVIIGALGLAAYYLFKRAMDAIPTSDEAKQAIRAVTSKAIDDAVPVVVNPLAITDPTFLQRVDMAVLSVMPGISGIWTANALQRAMMESDIYQSAYRWAVEFGNGGMPDFSNVQSGASWQ